ncbi:MAG: hypothetical protein O2930_06470 [Acidobacteria bacterium]|nr:hypothetical protein [Acidobacteriota bacterium]
MSPTVEALGSADVPQAVSVLSEVFFDYPLMRFVLGASEDYSDRLRLFVNFLVMSRMRRNEVVLGVRGADGLDAVAVVSYPEDGGVPPETTSDPDGTWAKLGDAAKERYESFRTVAGSVNVDPPHLYVSMFGVRRAGQERRCAEALLEAAEELSVFTPSSTGVTVRTEEPLHLSFYERNGYVVIGSAGAESAIRTWGLYRGNR